MWVSPGQGKDEAAKIFHGARLLIVDDDLPVADALAGALRELGAEVGLVGAAGRGVDLVGSIDPAVVLVEESVKDIDPLRAALMANPRLRFARLLAFRQKEVFPRGRPESETPPDGLFGHRLAALGERIAPALAPERALTRASIDLSRFEVDLGELGPVRALRALAAAESASVLRLQVRTASRSCAVEVSGGQLLSAQAFRAGGDRLDGLPALAQFLELDDGDGKVEQRSAASASNVVQPMPEAIAKALDLLATADTNAFQALGQDALSTVHRDLSDLAKESSSEPGHDDVTRQVKLADVTDRHPSIFDDTSDDRTLPSIPPPKLLESARGDESPEDKPPKKAPEETTRRARMSGKAAPPPKGPPPPSSALRMPRRIRTGAPKPPLDPRPSPKAKIPEPPPRAPAAKNAPKWKPPSPGAAQKASPKPARGAAKKASLGGAAQKTFPKARDEAAGASSPAPPARTPPAPAASLKSARSAEKPAANKPKGTLMGMPSLAPPGAPSQPPAPKAKAEEHPAFSTDNEPTAQDSLQDALGSLPPAAGDPEALASDDRAAGTGPSDPTGSDFGLADPAPAGDPGVRPPKAPRLTPDGIEAIAPSSSPPGIASPPSMAPAPARGSGFAARILLPSALMLAAAGVIGWIFVRQVPEPTATPLPVDPATLPSEPEPGAESDSESAEAASDSESDSESAEAASDSESAEAASDSESAEAASELESGSESATESESESEETGDLPSLAALPAVPVPFLPDARENGHDRERSEQLRELAGEHDGAARLRYLAAAAHTDRGNPHAVAAIAEYYSEAGEHPLAEAWAREAVRLRRRRVSYRVLLGDVLAAAGKRGQARQEWERALEIDPDYAAAASRLR